MDVQEHLVAHLEKEEDLLRRRDPSVTDVSIREQIYGSTDANNQHVPGTVEDSVIARLLDSMRESEPYLMEHINRLELLHGTSSWTLTKLLESIRAYERKQHEAPPLDSTSYGTVLVQHYKSKLQHQETSVGIKPYHFYDPTQYHVSMSEGNPPSSTSDPITKQVSTDQTLLNSQPIENIPTRTPGPSFTQSINKLSEVTESLQKIYESSHTSSDHKPVKQETTLPPPTQPTQPPFKKGKIRIPSHCLRWGSSTHLLWKCTEENDDTAAQLRADNEKSAGFRPNPRFREHETAATSPPTLHFHCSLTLKPWSVHIEAKRVSCGVSAYAQLNSSTRFTATIKLYHSYNRYIKALVDTGADRTCISTRWFHKLQQSSPSLTITSSAISLTGANGVPLQILGITRLSLPLTTGISVTTDVIICDNLTHDVILGLDVLLSTRAIIDLHGQSVLFRSPDPSVSPEYAYFTTTTPNNHYLTLSDDVTVQPRQQQLVHVASSSSIPDRSLLQPLSSIWGNSSLFIANGILNERPPHHQFQLLVINPTNQPVTLPRKARIAMITPLTSPLMEVGCINISTTSQSFQWNHVPSDLKLPDLNHLSSSHSSQSSNPLPLDDNLSSLQLQQLTKLLQENKDLFANNPNHPQCMKHIPPVHIHTSDNPPQRAPSYRRHPLANQYISDTVQDMLQSHLIEPTQSAWSFPVVLAAKPNGKIRFCIDYRKLNTVTIPDAYTLPRLDDILDSLHGKSYFSSLDAAAGFHQIPLHHDSRPKTAFSTRTGHFQWTRLPFGWINAPAVFQRTMDFILHGLTFECALVYMDDIIIYSSSFPEHLRHLHLIFARLRTFNCQLHMRKCRFRFRTLEYLGHIVSTNGVSTKPSIVSAVSNFPSPAVHPTQTSCKTAVKSFVALANFYRRFIKGFAQIAAPLITLTKKNAPFIWTPTHQQAFELLKTKITTAPVLAFPQWENTFYLSTDASNQGVGAVLEQRDGSSQLRPLLFLSYTFKEEEFRWSMPEKELFALVFALKKLRVYLYGRPFHWKTDAASLTTITKAKKLSPKLLRWALLISEFQFEAEHVDGTGNTVADCLSRYPTPTITSISLSNDQQASHPSTGAIFSHLPFNRHTFIQQQQLDPYCRFWIQKLYPTIALPSVSSTQQEETDRCKPLLPTTERRLSQRFLFLQDILWFIMDPPSYRRSLPPDKIHFLRPIVPYSLRTPVINHFHLPGHRKPTRTLRDIATHFYWPHLRSDISMFVASCHSCNSRNARSYLHGLLHSSPATSATHRMSLDIIGPRPITAEGYRYILVVINHYTKWIIAIPLRERNAGEIMHALEEHWLSESYTCQQTFADRAPELWTELFKTLLLRYGSTFVPGPPHHSQTQGHVERVNRTIQDAIAKNLEGSEHHWVRYLKPIVQAYRYTVHEATGYTPFFMMHGWEPLHPSLKTLLPPGEPQHLTEYVATLRNNITTAWNNATRHLKSYHDKTHKTLNRNRKPFFIPTGSFVYIRIPPSKGQSQGFQSYNPGLWRLLSYDIHSNNCTVTSKVGNIVRTQSVHSQYVFPFEGSQKFTPTPDYRMESHDQSTPQLQQTKDSHSQPTLKSHPHQSKPRRRGRPTTKHLNNTPR